MSNNHVFLEEVAIIFGESTNFLQPVPIDRLFDIAFKTEPQIDKFVKKLVDFPIITTYKRPFLFRLDFNYRSYNWIMTIINNQGIELTKKIRLIEDIVTLTITKKSDIDRIKRQLSRIDSGTRRTKASEAVNPISFVNPDRINELTLFKNKEFDLNKVIHICEELNVTYRNRAYLSVSLLIRTLIDHVPPIFGMKNFEEVVNSYGQKSSLGKHLRQLNEGARVRADLNIHSHIGSKESSPNENQVQFMTQTDTLLSEIIRKLN